MYDVIVLADLDDAPLGPLDKIGFANSCTSAHKASYDEIPG